MHSVTSNDGTKIAFERSGDGPALIILGGALADHQFYLPLERALSHRFTVYNLDRRGRGHSGDTHPYAVEREVEDVGALLTGAGDPVYLYGHSAGAALALRVAAAGLQIAKLALADPPFTPRGAHDEAAQAAHAAQAAQIQALHDRGDHKGSARVFLQDYGLDDDALEAMFQSAAGAAMLDAARALPYEYAMLGDGLVPTDLAATITVPTLIMADETSSDTAQALCAAMPRARFQAMQASAHELPPADIANVLIGFFLD